MVLEDCGHQHLSLLTAEVGLPLFCVSGVLGPAIQRWSPVAESFLGRTEDKVGSGIWLPSEDSPDPGRHQNVGVCGLGSGELVESLFSIF